MFAWDFRDGFVCDLFEYKFLPSSDEYGKDVFFLPLDELAGLIPGTRESENAVEAVELAKAWLSENLASNAKSKDIFKGRRRRRMTVYFDETH